MIMLIGGGVNRSRLRGGPYFHGEECNECVVFVDGDAFTPDADGNSWAAAFAVRGPTDLRCQVWVAGM